MVGEPPAWDAFSKVSLKNIDPSEYEDDDEPVTRAGSSSTAITNAKPTTLSGWDPETSRQSILTQEQMEEGGGMGAMDLGDWRVTAMDERDVGKIMDASHGEKTIMKELLQAGGPRENPHPPNQVEITYIGRMRVEGGLVPIELRHSLP